MSDFKAGVRAALDAMAALPMTTDGARMAGMEACYDAVEALLRPEPAPRPMTGILATLTDEQRAAVLAYDGDETLGDPAMSRISALGELGRAFNRVADSVGDISDDLARDIALVEAAIATIRKVAAPTCTAQTGPAAACVYREPLLRTAADQERG